MTECENNTSPEPRAPLVLVVEDDILTRFGAAEALRAAGLVVVEAINADEALTLLQAGLEPDAIFTDVRMPGSIDGLQLVDKARAIAPRAKILVASGESIGSAGEDASFAFFRKPYDLSRIVQRIKSVVSGEHNDGEFPTGPRSP